jgi:hypothetical protein
MMSDYKVEKDRFSVKLFFSDGTVEEGNIYLSLLAAHHEGRESVRDVLNYPDPFLPVNFLGGTTRLVNKENLSMVSYPTEDERGEPVDLASTQCEVVLRLINSVRVEGRFIFLLPPHSSRVKDYLNQAEPFVELRKEQEIYLVNRRHIVFVEEK